MIYARLIGIDTYASGAQLYGCKRDVANMTAFLGLLQAQVLDPSLQDGKANRAAIIEKLEGDIANLADGDQLLIHFSGHGTTVDVGGRAEAIVCPYDFREGIAATGIGPGDVDALVAKLPYATARITIFADCCFSGGLQTDYFTTLSRTISGAMQVVGSWLRISPRRVRVRSFARSPIFTAAASQPALAAKDEKRNVVVLAANRGKSGECNFGKGTEGVFTHFLIQRLNEAGTAESASTTCAGVNELTSSERFDQEAELHGRKASYGTPLIQAANASPSPVVPSTTLT
jgi:hypothetical protein